MTSIHSEKKYMRLSGLPLIAEIYPICPVLGKQCNGAWRFYRPYDEIPLSPIPHLPLH